MRPAGRAGGAVWLVNDIDKQERREKDFQQAQALAAAQVQQQRLGLTDVVATWPSRGMMTRSMIKINWPRGSTFQLFLLSGSITSRRWRLGQGHGGAGRASHSGGSWTARADHCRVRCSYPSPVYIRPAPRGCVSLPAVLWWLLPPLVSSQSSRTNSRPAGRLYRGARPGGRGSYPLNSTCRPRSRMSLRDAG